MPRLSQEERGTTSAEEEDGALPVAKRCKGMTRDTTSAEVEDEDDDFAMPNSTLELLKHTISGMREPEWMGPVRACMVVHGRHILLHLISDGSQDRFIFEWYDDAQSYDPTEETRTPLECPADDEELKAQFAEIAKGLMATEGTAGDFAYHEDDDEDEDCEISGDIPPKAIFSEETCTGIYDILDSHETHWPYCVDNVFFDTNIHGAHIRIARARWWERETEVGCIKVRRMDTDARLLLCAGDVDPDFVSSMYQVELALRPRD